VAWPYDDGFAEALNRSFDDYRQWRAQRRAKACGERIARTFGVHALPSEEGVRVFGDIPALEVSIDLTVRRRIWPGGFFGRAVESALLEVPLSAEAIFAPLRTGDGLPVGDCLGSQSPLDESVRAVLRPLERLDVVIRPEFLEVELSPPRRMGPKRWAELLCEHTRRLARSAVELNRLARAVRLGSGDAARPASG
jgi:hypothetical protein